MDHDRYDHKILLRLGPIHTVQYITDESCFREDNSLEIENVNLPRNKNMQFMERKSPSLQKHVSAFSILGVKAGHNTALWGELLMLYKNRHELYVQGRS